MRVIGRLRDDRDNLVPATASCDWVLYSRLLVPSPAGPGRWRMSRLFFGTSCGTCKKLICFASFSRGGTGYHHASQGRFQPSPGGGGGQILLTRAATLARGMPRAPAAEHGRHEGQPLWLLLFCWPLGFRSPSRTLARELLDVRSECSPLKAQGPFAAPTCIRRCMGCCMECMESVWSGT